MVLENLPPIGILGTGLMGHGLAQVFAVKGCDVRMYDNNLAVLAESPARIRKNLAVFEELDLVTGDQAAACLERIHLATDMADLCMDRAFIIEAVSENLEIKRRVFSEMEGLTPPETILSSNTSAIPISSIAQGLARPERVLGTHFWNPPHVVPCVEVIKGDQTSDEVFEAVYGLMDRMGKVPVRVLKDVPGFLGNRMQHALWREAIKIVEHGIAEPEEVDKVVRSAFGLRLAFLGPLETADLAGLDLTCDVHQDLLPQLDRSVEPSPLLKEKLGRGETGAKSGRGFHTWSEEKLRRVIDRRDRVLLRILQQVNDA